jgi:biopolymer transport protein ExbD
MKPVSFRSHTQVSFDLTPIIDVVFLLITFFMLVCQFSISEQVEAQLPDKIVSAAASDAAEMATVSVTYDHGAIRYAVGADVLDAAESKLLEKMICSAINSRLANGESERIVSLRCDKRVPFEKVQPALLAIAQSRAEKIQWAVLPE